MSSSTPTSSEIDMKKNLSLIILMALGLIFGVGADLNSLAYQNSPTKIDFVKGPFELSQNGAGDAAVEQSAGINASFGTQLQATVTESGNPVSGATVTFTAPGSGPSGTFPGNVTTANAVTNGSGVATAPVFTANGTAGGPYNVVASLGTGLPTANFSLSNIKANQTITFGALANKTFGDPDFPVSATATSGLPVS